MQTSTIGRIKSRDQRARNLTKSQRRQAGLRERSRNAKLYLARRLAWQAVLWLICVTGLMSLAAPVAAQTLGYTYNVNNIYQVNLSNGAVTTVWTFSPALTAAAAIAQRTSDGMIFFINGNTGNNQVYRWNPNTPAVAPVLLGTTGAATPYLPRLSFAANGTLYAVGTAANPNLYTINITTGAATVVGSSLTGTVSGGGDIAFAPNGTLYMMVGTTLYTVPITGGAVTTIGTITGMTGTVTGLAFDSAGNLIASNSATPAALYSIPLTGGAATLVGTSTVGMGDMASALAPDLTITKTHTGNFTQGQTGATYTVTVSNSGNLLTTGTVSVTDAVPSGLTPTAASGTGWTCSIAGQDVTCSSSTSIAVGATAPAITLTVNVSPTVPASVTNTASVSGGSEFNTANNGANDATTVAVLPQGFKSFKLTTDADNSGTITAGDTLTYTVQYANTGTASFSGFQINDQLPSGITKSGSHTVTVSGAGTSASANGAYTGASAGAVSDTLATGATLAASGVIKVDIPVTVNTGFTGSLSNQANATASGNSMTVPTDNVDATTGGLPVGVIVPIGSVPQTQNPTTDPTTATVAGFPNVGLVKAVAPTGDQPPGTDLTYTIVFTNAGTGAAQSFLVFDLIPTNTDFKIGSATLNAGTTGLTFVIEYSNDGGTTWTYTPVSGGGSALAGYDRNVQAIRWRVTAGNLSQTAPNNTGEVGFTVIIR